MACICDAFGLTLPGGCAVRASSAPNVLAHELGHAQGLPDLYAARDDMPPIWGNPSYEWLPGDFGTTSDEGYYPDTVSQVAVIRRMLMDASGPPTARDLTTGSVHAIWRPIYSNDPFTETNVPVGFFRNAFPNPHSN